MGVTISRIPAKVVEVVQEAPIVVEVEAPRVQQVVKTDSGIPRGRLYRKERGGAYVKPQHKPYQKPLDQLLPKRYNTPVEIEPEPVYYGTYRCDTCRDTGKVIVFDECENCYGKGCHKCNNRGDIKNYIPCQECKKRIAYK